MRAYDSDRAHALVTQINRHDRGITNPHYERGARTCWRTMRALGFDDVELLSFPIDGQRLYGNWKTPRHWTVRRARLQLKINGQWQTYADHQKIPTSLYTYSAPTAGEVHVRLVAWDAPDTAGNLVFSGDGQADLSGLRQRRARGVVSDFAPNWAGVRTDRDFRDGHRWDNSFLLEDEDGLVGFSLSRNQGAVVRRELAAHGNVECRYRVDGRLGAGEILCVTGCLKGAIKPEEEVVVVAHLYEPGANDNGSGVAGSIEALRTLQALVREGRLAPPVRTIRVVFTLEIIGFLAYFSRATTPGTRYVAGVNPDMIGEDHRKCRSVLHIYQTPDAAISFADPLLIEMVRRTAAPSFRHDLKGFIVNDNIVSDPAIGIPCPALIHLRDRFYHSNEDTPANVSPRTLKTVGGAMAAYLYAVAALDRNTAREVAALCVGHARDRLKRTVAARGALTQGMAAYVVAREQERIRSIERLTGADLTAARARIAKLTQMAKPAADPRERPPAAAVREARQWIPVRTVIGPMTFQHLPIDVRKTRPFHPMWSSPLAQTLFWADGKRTLWDIHQQCRWELAKPLSLPDLVAFFKLLAREKLIRLRRAQVPA